MTPKKVANWMLNEFSGICRKAGTTIPTCGVSPQDFANLLLLHEGSLLSRDEVKKVLSGWVEDNGEGMKR